MSKSADKCLPFFKILRRAERFRWDEEAEQAFQDLKQYLSSPPILSKPTPGETLHLYLGVSSESISAALTREDNGLQKPVYYISKVLQGAEMRYPMAEQCALAVLTAARKLRPYFQAHSIVVLTGQPLRQILQRPDTAGRLIKWSVELGEFDIDYKPRPAVKAQVLADFIVECTRAEQSSTEKLSSDKAGQSSTEKPSSDNAGQSSTEKLSSATTEATSALPPWQLYVDGSSHRQGSGAGLILLGPGGFEVEYALRFQFKASNNQAEYEALIAGLSIARDMKISSLTAFSDSQLIVGQVSGAYEAKEPTMKQYVEKVRELTKGFHQCTVVRIPRAKNSRADALSKLASASLQEISRQVFFETLPSPSINSSLQVMQLEGEAEEVDWRTPIKAYLKEGAVPADKSEAKNLRIKSARYLLLQGELYRRSFSYPVLKCLGPKDAGYAMQEVHEGICGNHMGARTLSYKLLRYGYYWPTIKKDCAKMVRSCDECQKFSDLQHVPKAELTSLSSPCPFAQWGLDILGPFPPAPGQRKFIFVAIDYFTKWVEAEAVATITSQRAIDFVWKNIVCRFGIPLTIITDNGKQFDNSSFRDYCQGLGIGLKFTSVAHPQTNGQVEAVNKAILHGLKTKLQSKGQWADDLQEVLWAYRTTEKNATGETPFNLTYGTEALLPVEVGLPSHRRLSMDEQSNNDALRTNLDLVEEVRLTAATRMAINQRRVAKAYNKRVKATQFRVGSLVLRKLTASGQHPGKLGPNWEGPYKVAGMIREGTYRLEYLNGKPLSHPWNSQNLRQYYQ